jgi:Ca2+-binding EF-hand superfamily protein
MAQKIFNALDVDKKGKLGIDEVSAGFAILHKKLHDRFGFDLLNTNLDLEATMQILDEDEDGFITIGDVYKYLRRRNRIMSKGFSLMDVKLTRNSNDKEVVANTLQKIFNVLDTKKCGQLTS